MFRAKRNGNELSINLIIGVAIGLLILLVLAFLLMGGFSNWNKGTGCTQHGGTCHTSCPEEQGLMISGWPCDNSDVCCTKSIIGGS